jgi:hypothetical protein
MLRKMVQLISFSLIFFLIGGTAIYGQSNSQPIKPSPHHNPEVPRITAFEAMELYKQGKLILANGHESGTYARGHIVGDISLPNGKVQYMNIKLPKNFIIAFYCA